MLVSEIDRTQVRRPKLVRCLMSRRSKGCCSDCATALSGIHYNLEPPRSVGCQFEIQKPFPRCHPFFTI